MEFPMHWLIILVVVLILFGGRKIPELMHGLGEGVRGFKEGMSGSHAQNTTTPPAQPPAATTEKPGEEKKEREARRTFEGIGVGPRLGRGPFCFSSSFESASTEEPEQAPALQDCVQTVAENAYPVRKICTFDQ